MKQKLCGLYQILNKVNNHFYIGSSSNIDWRFYIHQWLLRKNKHCNAHLQRAWNKYGEDNFEFSILHLLDKSDCLIEEQKLLDKHYGKVYCYNLDCRAKLNDDLANQKRSRALKGRKCSPEVRLKMSLSQKNKKITPKILNGWKKSGEALVQYRNLHKDEFEKKRIAGCIGKKQSEHFKQIMSEKMTGRVISKETRLKISQSQRGVPKPPRTIEHQEKLNMSHRGKKRSQETCERLRQALLKYYETKRNENHKI